MSVIDTITDEGHFYDWLQQSDNYKDNFSYEGANALQAYLDNLSDEIGEPIEFDPIAWCCEYSEYTDLKEIQKSYDNIEDMEDLESRTTVIPIEGTERFIIQDF